MKMISYVFVILTVLLNSNCSVTTTTGNNSAGVANTQNSATPQTAQNATGNLPQNAETGVKDDQNSPDTLIKDLYKTHEKDAGKIINGKSRAMIDKFFDKNLADLIWKDLTTHKDEVGVIDFDLFYNTQDPDIKNLVVGTPKITGDKALVSVKFENSGRKENLVYSLVQQKSSWKISDIDYGQGNTLLKYFKDAAQDTSKNESGDGNFEGTYQVGDTTCAVKPIKMAFEIKWAKGTGTMVFFFVGEDGNDFKYSSEDKGNGIDSFIFDDESLTTGKFIRADGEEMAVKKK
jgi:hypothetical protein